MRFYLLRVAALFFALSVGVYAVWMWPSSSKLLFDESVNVKPVILITSEQIEPSPKQTLVAIDPLPQNKTGSNDFLSIAEHDLIFEGICLRLKKLPAFMGKNGRQTFYISDVKYDDGEFAYAYWKEENSIIVLQLPVYGEPTDSDLYWLSGKAYIDLNKDVVPKELDNMGCCLVTKAWADKIKKSCKAGYKLKVITKAK